MYERNSFYDRKHKYAICKGSRENHEIIVAGFTSQKATMECIKEFKKQGIDTKKFFIKAYK